MVKTWFLSLHLWLHWQDHIWKTPVMCYQHCDSNCLPGMSKRMDVCVTLRPYLRSNIPFPFVPYSSPRFQPTTTINKMSGFHYLPCPLCQCNINESQPNNFYMFPLDQKHVSPKKWHWDSRFIQISNGNFQSCQLETYPSVSYQKRSLLFHQRCFDFVKHLSHPQLCLLIDVVEPTFLNQLLPPESKYGGFSSHGSRFLPRWTMLKLFQRLPLEVQDMVFDYDIGCLLFVIKAASQIAAGHHGLETIPEQRLTQEKLILKHTVWIHQIDISSQVYINCLSDTDTTGGESGMESHNYNLGESNYIAVKSDRIGVIDIAFKATQGRPEWILGNPSGRQFQAEISIIWYADVRQLQIIRDVITTPMLTLDKTNNSTDLEMLCYYPIKSDWSWTIFPMSTVSSVRLLGWFQLFCGNGTNCTWWSICLFHLSNLYPIQHAKEDLIRYPPWADWDLSYHS